MLNYLWAAMLILGIVYGALQGRLPELTEAALESAGEAVTLCITMAGIMALWVGLMEIAQRSGVIRRASRAIAPFMNFMFPRLPREHPGQRVYHDQCDRQYLRSRLGCHSGRAESHGGVERSGGGAKKDGTAGTEKGDGQQRNVYFFGAEYRVFAADSGEYHRLSKPVRQCESGCDSGSFAGGDADQRRGGGGVL